MLRRLLLVVALALPNEAWANRLFTSGAETNNFLQTEWNATTGSPAFVTTPVHSGTYSIGLTLSASAAFFRSDLPTSVTTGTFHVRFYVRFASDPDAFATLFDAKSSADATQVSVVLLDGAPDNLKLDIESSPGSATCPTAISLDTWYRLELEFVLSDTVGSLHLKAYVGDEPTTTFCDISLTNQDTLATDFQRSVFGIPQSVTATSYWDDFALNDAAGTFQTSWPGPASIALMEPASDDTVTWTKTGANCSGTTNTDCVDDEPGTPDDLSGYNETATVQTDRLNSTTLTGPDADDDITLVDLYVRVGGATTTGSSTFRLSLWDEAGVETNGGGSTTACDRAAGWAPPAWSSASHLAFDPGADVKATVESYDMGYEPSALSGASQRCRVTSLWANVEWLAAAPPAAKRRKTLLGAGH